MFVSFWEMAGMEEWLSCGAALHPSRTHSAPAHAFWRKGKNGRWPEVPAAVGRRHGKTVPRWITGLLKAHLPFQPRGLNEFPCDVALQPWDSSRSPLLCAQTPDWWPSPKASGSSRWVWASRHAGNTAVPDTSGRRRPNAEPSLTWRLRECGKKSWENKTKTRNDLGCLAIVPIPKITKRHWPCQVKINQTNHSVLQPRKQELHSSLVLFSDF